MDHWHAAFDTSQPTNHQYTGFYGWLIILVFFMFMPSQAAAAPLPTESVAPESIVLLEPVMLGGHQQWLLARGEKRSNPILLFLHGGAGDPYIGLLHEYQSELEKYFVVVQWDQRGSGRSIPNTAPESMTINQFQADTHELVLLLKAKFNRDKIYILGHSWGSYLGIMEAQNHPENLYAYIGTGQMVDLIKQEQMSHDFVVAQAQADHNTKALKQLKAIGYPPYENIVQGFNTKYSWLWRYGGMLDGESGPWPFIKALLTMQETSLLDIRRFERVGTQSLQQLAANEGSQFWHLKAPDIHHHFEIPMFFITGENDRVTPLALIQTYVKTLHAPLKQSMVIPHAGHFAFFIEPNQFAAAMLNIRHQTYPQGPVRDGILSK